MRKLASIQKIQSICPIDGADKIEKATVLGWEVIIQKNSCFHEGDLIVFIETDALLPDTETFEFMSKYKWRVKTIKMRNQISQGLVMPLSILPENMKKSVGMDVSEILGIKKYDPEGEQEAKLRIERVKIEKSKIKRFFMRNKTIREWLNPPKTGGFPSFIKRTDETRIQNMPWVTETYKGKKFILTEKIDGQSATYFLVRNPKKWQFWKKYIFGVCSRNIHLKTPDCSSYWTIAKKYKIENVLRKMIGDSELVVLQGEIVGPGIQSNVYHYDEYEFFAFNLLFDRKLVDTWGMSDLLMEYGIFSVPVLDWEYELPETVNELVESANGNSTLGYFDAETNIVEYPIREGFVIRNNEHGVSFKVISPNYLLSKDI